MVAEIASPVRESVASQDGQNWVTQDAQVGEIWGEADALQVFANVEMVQP